MKPILLHPQAQADLEGIWDYSCDMWGVAQANRYVGGIRRAIEGVASGEAVPRSAEEVRPGLQKVAVGRHVVFFRQGDAVEVVRVLHERMDVGGV